MGTLCPVVYFSRGTLPNERVGDLARDPSPAPRHGNQVPDPEVAIRSPGRGWRWA